MLDRQAARPYVGTSREVDALLLLVERERREGALLYTYIILIYIYTCTDSRKKIKNYIIFFYFAPASVRSCTISGNFKCLATVSGGHPS